MKVNKDAPSYLRQAPASQVNPVKPPNPLHDLLASFQRDPVIGQYANRKVKP